jgi:hypothetical protein
MKRREKGFTLVEIIVTFCLISTISFLLFQIILSLKNLYTASDYKTVLLIDQGNLTRRINDDFFSLNVEEIKTCTDATNRALCLDFLLSDPSNRSEAGELVKVTKRLEIIKPQANEDGKIIYDGYAMTFAKGSTLGEVTASLSYIPDDTVRYNTFLTIDAPITNKLSSGEFGLHFTTQFYTEMDASGELPLATSTKYNQLKEVAWGLTSIQPITLTTFTVNDMIRRVVTTENGQFTKDGLYDVSLESWNQIDKDFPKYVYKGTNPNNYIVMDSKCYRIMQITRENGLKVIYDGTYVGNTCRQDATASISSPYGTNNNWLNSQIRNTAVNNFALHKNISTNSNFFYGAIQIPSTSTEDTFDKMMDMLVHQKGSSATPTIASGYYGDHAKSIGIPTVADYILSSRNEACTGLIKAREGACNTTNYLAKNYNYWLLNADGSNATHAWSILGGKLTSSASGTSLGVRPVLYLKASTTFTLEQGATGVKGSSTNPYIVNS